jgi:hypothetical protein
MSPPGVSNGLPVAVLAVARGVAVTNAHHTQPLLEKIEEVFQ